MIGIKTPINGTTFLYCPCDEGETEAFHSSFSIRKNVIFEELDKAVASKQCVLLHCSAGQNRSAAILFSYIKERCPEVSCHKINTFLREIKQHVEPLREKLVRNEPSNMMNIACRHYCGADECTARK